MVVVMPMVVRIGVTVRAMFLCMAVVLRVRMGMRLSLDLTIARFRQQFLGMRAIRRAMGVGMRPAAAAMRVMGVWLRGLPGWQRGA